MGQPAAQERTRGPCRAHGRGRQRCVSCWSRPTSSRTERTVPGASPGPSVTFRPADQRASWLRRR
jgi:hypothetical protein